MGGILGRWNTLSSRVTALLIVLVATSVVIMAGLGYSTLTGVTDENSGIRIDRAARAASSIMAHATDDAITVTRDDEGRPLALVVSDETDAWTRNPTFFDLVLEIGRTNQGAANLFAMNDATGGFDRFATTFRKPDGTMPPPMSVMPGHPAYANLIAGRPHIGEVPVMGRMRLAYLTPVVNPAGGVAGALAVDVGWVDDLVVARNALRGEILLVSSLILAMAAILGILMMSREMRPLKNLSRFAHAIASGTDDTPVPHADRRDEIGALAQGLGRVAALQDELEHLAYTDPLTGRGNRARYLADLKRVVADTRAKGVHAALLHIDLDRFKEINDAFGQTAGDAVLARVAQMLSARVGGDAPLARLAGDDFTIIVRHDARPGAMADLCESILEDLSTPVALPQGEANVTASIGVVLLPRDARTADEAHRNAELALRRAKAEGPGTFVFYAEEFNAQVQNELLMERRLRAAIAERGLAVHFQPQIRVTDESLYGLEALVRWPREGGMISPADFIPLAEKSGLIIDLGAFVLDESCRQAKAWMAQGFDFGHVSVNVSPVQLWQPGFVSTVAQTLRRHDLPGHAICLEVTEGVFVDHDEGRVARVLASLRELGVCLSLDDFGSGYSSLGYLNRLPFDQLKVDRSFVSNVHVDSRKAELLRGVVALGAGLGLEIVVEGAEAPEEVTLIRALPCTAIQGFAYARPVPAGQVVHEVARIVRASGEPEVAAA